MDKKILDVQEQLEFARATVAVLRTLVILDTDSQKETMTYRELANVIGLISDSPNDRWQPWHRQQVRNILNLVAAIESKGGKKIADRLQFDRIVNAKSRKPGIGIQKKTRLVTSK